MVQYSHGNNYADKLQDPRWQKKRLEIFCRDNWACTNCKDTGNSLCVHHFLYIPNLEPWDYPNNLLTTLCELCHNICTNCYHYQEFKHCSCYEPQDIIQYCPDFILC
jgi:hypothetical protein